MKYVILIHSNPQPWGHPTDQFTEEGRALGREWHDSTGATFDEHLKEMSERGELVHAEALGDPRESRLFGWTPDAHPVSDGPYAETAEHLAGFFVIDVESQERAEQIADWFAQPGGTVELRPCWRG